MMHRSPWSGSARARCLKQLNEAPCGLPVVVCAVCAVCGLRPHMHPAPLASADARRAPSRLSRTARCTACIRPCMLRSLVCCVSFNCQSLSLASSPNLLLLCAPTLVLHSRSTHYYSHKEPWCSCSIIRQPDSSRLRVGFSRFSESMSAASLSSAASTSCLLTRWK